MKRVLVTGGSRGIGAAVVSVLHEDSKWEVVAPTREECDLLSRTSIDQFLSSCGKFDALVNVAGINEHSELSKIDEETLLATEQVNVNAPLSLIRGLVPGMISRGGGRIVNFSSIWGVRSKEKRTMYSISKFGIVGLTRALSHELGPLGILINAVAPGFVLTEMTRKNLSEDEQSRLCAEIPLRRMATPDEIARTVRFLISYDNT